MLGDGEKDGMIMIYRYFRIHVCNLVERCGIYQVLLLFLVTLKSASRIPPSILH
jgi:hypothetical protein